MPAQTSSVGITCSDLGGCGTVLSWGGAEIMPSRLFSCEWGSYP